VYTVYIYIYGYLSESGTHYAVSRYYGGGVPPGSIRRPASQPAKGNSGRGALIWTGRHFFALPHHAAVTRSPYGTAAVLVFICRRRVIRPAHVILYLFCNTQDVDLGRR